MSVPPIVPVLALVAAVLSAGATIFIRQGLRTSGSLSGFWINVLVGMIAIWVAVAVTGGPGPVSPKAFGYFVLAGLVGMVAGRLFRFVAIERVGASVAAALINLNPMVATILAIVLLGERVTLPIVVGTLVIVLGTVTRSPSSRTARIVAIIGFRLISAAATEAPTRSMATKRKSRPATVPTRPASMK